jgi:hypothetical protein
MDKRGYIIGSGVKAAYRNAQTSTCYTIMRDLGVKVRDAVDACQL